MPPFTPSPPAVQTMIPQSISSPYRFQPMKQATKPKPFMGPPSEMDFRSRKQLLLHPHHRTDPLVWCYGILCVVFSLLLILAGIATLIIFLVIKPRNPLFETANASLNSIYLDSPAYFNGDLTLLANFSNPNQKVHITFQYISLELYFNDRLVSAQALRPFAQRSRESTIQAVHMVSSQVLLPPDLAVRLQDQVRRNSVLYEIRGTFKVRASLGFMHFTYWVYARCEIELGAPPRGVLLARSCRTKQ
ncbi:Protein YLS9 [Carex littledalei]|uniref:Protein YLS9 n=1 Tax=Carex littledalei TaxID=544730 RepID=A0A833VKA0_9POAL|nr:Protein YLS9 [Carex littledalei]